jgi:hypothetical protein
MVAAGQLGGELGALLKEAGAKPVKMGPADLEVVGGIGSVNAALIKLLEDLLEKWLG